MNKQYNENVQAALNGLNTGRLKIENEKKSLYIICVFNNKESIYLSSYEDLSEDYAKRFEEITGIKAEDSEEFTMLAEAFLNKFKIEEIAELIALSIETCDCMCGYEHYLRLIRN